MDSPRTNAIITTEMKTIPLRLEPENERPMDVDEDTVRSVCTDAVFDRGRNYRQEGRIERIDRFGDRVTAVVRGSQLYDVTVEFDGDLDPRCTCPYSGSGECKHVVAVLLTVADDPPADESDRVESVIEDLSAEDLRGFLRSALAENPQLRETFLAQFGDQSKPVEEYRAEIERLFDQHTQDYPVVTDAIDFSQQFDRAEQYRERERYLEAATVYRALFEAIDDNHTRIDAAYDHYAQALQSALEGYVDCVLATDPDPEELDRYAGVLESQATADPRINSQQFHRAIDDLEDRGK